MANGNPARTKSLAKKAAIVKRQRKAAELKAQGLTTPEIAERLGVKDRQAKYDVLHGVELWRKDIVVDVSMRVIRLEFLFGLAIKGYMASLEKPTETTIVDRDKDSQPAGHRIIEQLPPGGDPRFITEARKIEESLRQLYGLNKEQNPGGVTVNVNVNAEAEQRRARLARLSQRCGVEGVVIEGSATESSDDHKSNGHSQNGHAKGNGKSI